MTKKKLTAQPTKTPVSTKPSEAAITFMALVSKYSYQQGPDAKNTGLTNFTFFAGAGFSKSWDPKAPLGSELFELDTNVIERVADAGTLMRMFNLSEFDKITPEQLRQIIYQIDMYERYPDVRSRYMDEQNLRIFRGALRAAIVDRYQDITSLNYFDPKISKFPLLKSTKEQRNILDFFKHLASKINGSQGIVEGIRTQFITTNYDYVIETILDNIIGNDDSLFLYTYRGFTPTLIVNEPNLTPVHEHWLVQHLLKINGGFEILRQTDSYTLDYSERSTEKIITNPPILMLASREQDYSDPYFKTIFPKVIRLIRETTVLIIVGYSLPQDDALIRFFLRQLAEEPEDGRDKVIFFIGPGNSSDKSEVIKEVFPMNTPKLIPYNQGFDEFAAECKTLI